MSAAVEELRTPRLVLRRWRDGDYEPMEAINSHPKVTPLLNRHMDEEAVATFPERTERHWEEHGFGHWAVEPRDGPLGGEMIGFVGVAYPAICRRSQPFRSSAGASRRPLGGVATRRRRRSPPAMMPSGGSACRR